jgi:hypothetical protein
MSMPSSSSSSADQQQQQQHQGPVPYSINPKLSVTRIGSRAYYKALEQLAPQIRLELAQSEDARKFASNQDDPVLKKWVSLSLSAWCMVVLCMQMSSVSCGLDPAALFTRTSGPHWPPGGLAQQPVRLSFAQ